MKTIDMQMQSRIPLYCRIANDLTEIIKNSKANELLPSEPDLVEKYGVSRGTIKEAMNLLEQQGLIYRRHGKGTFVAEPIISRHSQTVPSFSEDIKQHGYLPSIKLLSLGKTSTSSHILKILSLDSSDIVWKVERIFLADAIPLALVTSYLPVSEFPTLTAFDVESGLYKALDRRYNSRPTWASDSYSAILASGKLKELLSLKEGDPVLYSERLAYLSNMRPIEYVESYIRGDRFTVYVDWMPQGQDVNISRQEPNPQQDKDSCI